MVKKTLFEVEEDEPVL